MKVCILGKGLTSLALAQALLNKGIRVDLFSDDKVKYYSRTQTLGISRANIEYFNKNIINIDKFLWDINKIEIFSQNLKNEKVIEFQNKNSRLFSIIKNQDLYNCLYSKIKKNKLFRLKKNYQNKNLKLEDYELIFNCEFNHKFTKKYFNKKIDKNYNSFAFITEIEHKKIENNTAIQIFTRNGPLAFLPISEKKTSIVYSLNRSIDIDVVEEIKKHNFKYKISNFQKIDKFILKSSSNRIYHYKNILAFGDLLHKIHPLAGQGFNMVIRDIKDLIELIKARLDLGLIVDQSICVDFERKTKHKNYIFSNGIDIVHEFFKFESNTKTRAISKSIQILGKNKFINRTFTKLADTGIII